MQLNDKLTRVSLIIALATTLVGGISWIVSVESQTMINDESIRELKIEIEETEEKTNDINNRLHRIEEKINYIVLLMRERSARGHTHEKN